MTEKTTVDQIADRVDPKPKRTNNKPKPKPGEVDLRIPLNTVEMPSFRLHLDISLHGEQAVSLRRVASALDSRQETLANGRRVVNTNDAMRWILEQIAEKSREIDEVFGGRF